MNSRPDAEYEKAIRASLIESGLIVEEEEELDPFVFFVPSFLYQIDLEKMA